MMNIWYEHSVGIGPLWMLGLFSIGSILFLALMLAVIALKGYSLWHAAKRDDRGWFVALLIVNTFGILELCYLYFVVGKWHGKGADNKSDKPIV